MFKKDVYHIFGHFSYTTIKINIKIVLGKSAKTNLLACCSVCWDLQIPHILLMLPDSILAPHFRCSESEIRVSKGHLFCRHFTDVINEFVQFFIIHHSVGVDVFLHQNLNVVLVICGYREFAFGLYLVFDMVELRHVVAVVEKVVEASEAELQRFSILYLFVAKCNLLS